AIGNCEVFLDTLPRLSLFARDQAVSFFFSRLAGDVSDHGVDLSGTRSWNDDNHRGDLVLYDTDKQKIRQIDDSHDRFDSRGSAGSSHVRARILPERQDFEFSQSRRIRFRGRLQHHSGYKGDRFGWMD